MSHGGKPYRTLDIDGFEVLAGRGSEEHDILTFEVAQPRDLCMHVGGGDAGEPRRRAQPQRRRGPAGGHRARGGGHGVVLESHEMPHV